MSQVKIFYSILTRGRLQFLRQWKTSLQGMRAPRLTAKGDAVVCLLCMFSTSNQQQTEHNHYAFTFYILNNTVYVSMFKKFDPSSDVSTSTQVKASVQRAIRSQIQQAHPALTNDILDELLPKKHPLVQYKVGPHLMLYCRHVEHDDDRSPTDEPMFFQHRDGPILPTLKLVHQYPSLELTSVTVDKGAIPFILGGASIMCPGLTKEGCSIMPPDGVEQDEQGFDKPGLEKGDGVVIYAEGKEHAIAVGTMTMSSAEIREKNKGIGIDVAHFIGDGLFQTDEIH